LAGLDVPEQLVPEPVPLRLAPALASLALEIRLVDRSPDHLEPLPDPLHRVREAAVEPGDRDVPVRVERRQLRERRLCPRGDVVHEGAGREPVELPAGDEAEQVGAIAAHAPTSGASGSSKSSWASSTRAMPADWISSCSFSEYREWP